MSTKQSQQSILRQEPESSSTPSNSYTSGSAVPPFTDPPVDEDMTTNPRRISQTEEHPRLEKLRQLAKKQAAGVRDAAADAKELRKQRLGYTRLSPKKTVTKRQLSNVRSAEICRAAQGIYTEYLEKEIGEEEERQRGLIEKLFEQTESCYLLQDRIRELERKKEGGSWIAEEESGSFFPPPAVANTWVRAEFTSFEDFAAGLADSNMDMLGMEKIVDDVRFEKAEVCEQGEFEDLDMSMEHGNIAGGDGSEMGNFSAMRKREYSPVTVFQTAPVIPRPALLMPSMSRGY